MNYLVSNTKIPEPADLQKLFSQTDWADKRTLNEIKQMLENTPCLVTVWHEEHLVGFGRALTDGICRALIDDIIVDSTYRGQGIGRNIMNNLMSRLQGVEEIFLNAHEHMEEYYKQFGFRKFGLMTMLASRIKDKL